MTEFELEYYALAKQNNIDFYRVEDLIGGWRDFVDECETGYAWTLFEYWEDLSFRTDIQKALELEELKKYEEYQHLESQILATDSLFKEISYLDNRVDIDDQYWWQKRLLSKTTEDYRTDVIEFVGEYL